jgi:hypothetical protein
MKGSVGVSFRMEYIFLGTPIYNKAYMKTIDSIFSFDKSNIAQIRLKVIEFYNVLKTILKSAFDLYSNLLKEKFFVKI